MAPAAGGSSGWTVTSQVPSTELGPDGKPQRGMQVNFTTKLGASAYVFVPWSDYSVERVKVLVGARAAQLDAVHTLSG